MFSVGDDIIINEEYEILEGQNLVHRLYFCHHFLNEIDGFGPVLGPVELGNSAEITVDWAPSSGLDEVHRAIQSFVNDIPSGRLGCR